MPDSSTGNDWFQDFSKHLHIRPGMYVGGLNAKGALNLLKEAIVELINFLRNDQLFIEWTIESERCYELKIKGDCKEGIANELYNKYSSAIGSVQILCAASSYCRIEVSEKEATHYLNFAGGTVERIRLPESKNAGLTVCFELSNTIFNNFPDYTSINMLCLHLARLNTKVKFLLKDTNKQYQNQNFHHFPEGIKTLFDSICSEEQVRDKRSLFIDESYNGNYYQIGIAFYAQRGRIISYADHYETTERGSLVDGVVRGVMDSYNRYKKNTDPLDIDSLVNSRSKSKFLRWMIIVCMVKTGNNEYIYYGSFRGAQLGMPEIKKDVRKLVDNKMSVWLNANPAIVSKKIF